MTSFKRIKFHGLCNDIGYLLWIGHWFRTFGSLSVVLRGSTVRRPVITNSRPMSKFGRVTVRATRLRQERGPNPPTQAQKYADYTIAPPLLK